MAEATSQAPALFPIRSHMDSGHLFTTQLRDKALLALEDAVQECRYRKPRASFAVRFALAYLWVYSGAGREPFDEFWRSFRAPHHPWTFSAANRALTFIYGQLGLERPEQVTWEMWSLWHKQVLQPEDSSKD